MSIRIRWRPGLGPEMIARLAPATAEEIVTHLALSWNLLPARYLLCRQRGEQILNDADMTQDGETYDLIVIDGSV